MVLDQFGNAVAERVSAFVGAGVTVAFVGTGITGNQVGAGEGTPVTISKKNWMKLLFQLLSGLSLFACYTLK